MLLPQDGQGSGRMPNGREYETVSNLVSLSLSSHLSSLWSLTQELFLSLSGPIPYQPTGLIPLEQVWFDAPGFHPRRHIKQDEQCLSANIFRPAKVTGPVARLPVFIFLQLA